WGSFDIKVTAFLKSGNSLSVEYFLNHDQIEPTRPVIKFQEVEQIQITDSQLLIYFQEGVRFFKGVHVSGKKEHMLSSEMLLCSSFENCTFDNVSFRGTDISGCNFELCDFQYCDLSKVRAVNCKFSSTDFSKTILHPQMFLKANLNGVRANFIYQEDSISNRIPKDRNFGDHEFQTWITKINNPFVDMEPKTRSVFISYAHQDQEIALVLDQWLRDQGVKTYLDSTNFQIGGDLYDEMSKFIGIADKILIIYSNNSKDRPFTRLERRMAQNRENESGQHNNLSIYLVVDDAELPPEQKHRLAIMAQGKRTKDVFNEILRGVLEEDKLPEKIDTKDYLNEKKKLF
ncbi:MAG: TIR domain-containing protein, partial [Bacteroidota bacterium]